LPTPAEIDEQVELERTQISQGLKELKNNTRKLEEKQYGSATIYGVVSIDNLLPLVVSRIDNSADRLRTRQNGYAFKEIIHILAQLEPEAAACIALKILFDCVFNTRTNTSQATHIATSIGTAIENECLIRHYERVCPGLLNVIKKNYWHASCGTQQKVRSLKTIINRYDVEHWTPWLVTNKTKLGGWLLDCICEVSGYFHKGYERKGRKTSVILMPTPAFMEQRDEIMAQAELFSPLAWPMLIEPNDWTTDGKHGGYLLNEVMKGYPMVRRGKWTLLQGEQPVAFLNRIQRVAYTLNPFVVDVAETLMEKGISVGKFIPIVEIPLPPKPPDIAENAEARKDYRRRAAEVCNINAQGFQKSCRTRMTMNAIKVFKEKIKFYLPWSLDYRGRAYPIPNILTPQDTDFGKSLIKFYEPAEMNEQAELWLAFQCATTYGCSKDTMADRITWSTENEELIERIATDPIGNRHEWEGTDSPWCFLAACDEYYHCVILRDRSTTNSCIYCDATCSGLQILAGLARDESTARLVNVVPSDKPQDAYQVIADTAKPHIPELLQPHCDRRVTKRTVMTIPYNSKPFSNRSYIREAFLDKGIDIDKEDLTAVVKAVRDAMHTVVPGPMQVMKWIESEVAAAIDRGAQEIQWTTPSGFVVIQKLMKPDIQRITLQLLGSCKLHVKKGDSAEVDKNHHKNATAPNLIHSLDASLLHISATRFQGPISFIHDSVLCRATDMSRLSSVVRETYMHLFAENNFLLDWANQIGAETYPPIIDTLKPESVIKSNYFFC